MADASSTKQLRLFVAIPMPEAVRDEIAGVQQELRQRVSRDAVRWTKPEQFHLTLRFLGDVPVERVPALQAAIGAACLGSPALRLRAQGVGFFPDARSPRVVWAGVNDDDGHLKDLQKKSDAAVPPFTPEPGTGKFSGHVTIGRVRHLNRPEIEKLAAHALAVQDRLFGEWLANEVKLLRSDLSPGGASHTLLAVFPLRG